LSNFIQFYPILTGFLTENLCSKQRQSKAKQSIVMAAVDPFEALFAKPETVASIHSTVADANIRYVFESRGVGPWFYKGLDELLVLCRASVSRVQRVLNAPTYSFRDAGVTEIVQEAYCEILQHYEGRLVEQGRDGTWTAAMLWAVYLRASKERGHVWGTAFAKPTSRVPFLDRVAGELYELALCRCPGITKATWNLRVEAVVNAAHRKHRLDRRRARSVETQQAGGALRSRLLETLHEDERVISPVGTDSEE